MSHHQSRAELTQAGVPERSIFSSSSVAAHLLRGVLGIAAIVAALMLAQDQPFASLALGVAALLALRGCPTCWTIGLIETIALRLRKKGGAQVPPSGEP